MIPAVAYLRVSSLAQSVEMQRHQVERLAESRGYAIGRWYVEKVSGRSIDRPELNALRAAARAGEFKAVLAYRLDRFARSGIRDMFELVESLRACGVEIVTAADGFDLTSPAAEVILAVMAWAAKAERLAINERIAAARSRLGDRWGRPSRVGSGVEARIKILLDGGHSIREIAQAVGVPRSTVGRVSQKLGAKKDPQV